MHTLKTELNQFTSEKLISDKELVDVRSQLVAALKVLCILTALLLPCSAFTLSLSTLHLSFSLCYLFLSLIYVYEIQDIYNITIIILLLLYY